MKVLMQANPSFFSILVMAFLLWGCDSPKVQDEVVEQAFLEEVVGTLASDEMQGRMAGTTAGLGAAQWIAEKMKNTGLKPWDSEEFLQQFQLSDSISGYNVVGYIEGKGSLKNEYLVLSAHYDHIGTKSPVAGDSIANGADDNATGVATILALGKALNTFVGRQKEARSLLIVAFDAEEMGLKGSKAWVDQVIPQRIQASQVAVGLNFEMLGKYPKGKSKQAFITGSEKSTLLAFLQTQTQEYDWNLIGDPYPKFGLYNRSDNASLAKVGIVAHTLSTDPIDEDQYYHTVDDEISTLDFEHTTNVANGVLMGVKPLVLGKNLPK